MISVRQHENVTIVRPEIHRLDEMLGRQLITAMREYLTPGAQVILNLADVMYLNSEAIGYITTCARRQAHHRGGLAVCCLQDGPRGVFKVLRMDRILSGVYDTEEDAIVSVQKPVRH